MANHFPLIINSTTSAIEELAVGDNLDLTGSAIVGANTLVSEGLITTNTGIQFPDGTIQTTAGGGPSSGNVWITSNISSFIAGAGLNFAVDYTDPTYPGGVFTLYQTAPIVPLYWKYTAPGITPTTFSTSDPHDTITYVPNTGSANTGVGAWTVVGSNTWIAIPSSEPIPFFKFDQPPFYGIVLTENTDYYVHTDMSTINGVSYNAFEFFTPQIATDPFFIYTASV